MRKLVKLFLVSMAFCSVGNNAFSQEVPAEVNTALASPFFGNLYANTYYSLIDRMGKNGFLPNR